MRTLTVGVAGGSIGGLTVAVLLHELGHDVHVFERSTSALEGRGAGIVVMPETERYFTEKDARESVGNSDVALTLKDWSYIDSSGQIVDAAPTFDRFTSWNTMYRALLRQIPEERYHLSHQVISFEQDDDSVTVNFAEGEPHSCDLLIAADGTTSTIRNIVSPQTTPDYVGYVAWRGMVLESDLEPETAAVFSDAMVYQVLDLSHILIYAIPGPDGSIIPGERALNFVWYRNTTGEAFEDVMTDTTGFRRPISVPPGLVQERHINELKSEAARVLAPQLRELVTKSEEPFIQAIFDMVADEFVHGRVILLGDAAAVARPHVAAGTAKACSDAWALRDLLAENSDLDTALGIYGAQQLEVAKIVASRAQRMGEAAQVTNTMIPGDTKWRFGLADPV